MPRPIPAIRRRLHELAAELGVPELSELAEATRRRPAVKIAPVGSRKMDEKVAAAIRAYALAHPFASNQQIAAVFNVNPGRVSESLGVDR